MEIIRIPKGAVIARLFISGRWNGRVQTQFQIESTMSSSIESGDYGSDDEAEAAAKAKAYHRDAVYLIIEDRA